MVSGSTGSEVTATIRTSGRPSARSRYSARCSYPDAAGPNSSSSSGATSWDGMSTIVRSSASRLGAESGRSRRSVACRSASRVSSINARLRRRLAWARLPQPPGA